MAQPENDVPVPVALVHCADYGEEKTGEAIRQILEAARLPVKTGMRVLVKPNLLQAFPLACATPVIVRGLCEWLQDHNARIIVADSPGFGRANVVARKIGLEDALKPLGLKMESLDQATSVNPPLFGANHPIRIMISRKALENDLIISVPRVKAHAQMRITLSVKNCFGCVSSMRKALAHARYGENRDFFADCLAALWAALPPVAALADGIVAMHVTGPVKGKPYRLGLLGTSSSAPALDKAIIHALGFEEDFFPMIRALKRRADNGDHAANPQLAFPLENPEDFSAPGFIAPEKLASASFNPLHLAKSLFRRAKAAFIAY